jgi:3-deoxy-D-manno-octulosonate 8-phosphate phosphatase (KDO 8-P phosphatase)
MENNMLEKAKQIKLIICDVDGVLTRGDIFFDALGNELKVWNVRDGLAYSILKRIAPDIQVGWITGRESKSVENRAKESGVKYLIQGCLFKRQAINDILKQANVKLHEIAYIGDDLVDLPAIKDVGLGICPIDAVDEVRDASDIIAPVKGGCGVFRYVVELVLKARGTWDKAIILFE